MKTFIQQRYEQVKDEIERLEYQLELLRTELPKLEQLHQAEATERESKRTEAERNVKVKLDCGVWVTGEDYNKIKRGELAVNLEKPKPTKPDKDEPPTSIEPETTKPNDNAEEIQNDTTEIEPDGTTDSNAT